MNTTSSSVFSTTFWSRSKVIFPAKLWVFLEVLLILSYTVKPTPYRPLLFFVPVAILVIYSLLFTRMINMEHVANTDWGMACRLMTILIFASTNILLSDVQRDLKPKKDGRHKKDDAREDGASRERNISEESFLTRLKWGLSLWFNPRVIDFADEPTSVLPPRPSQSTRLVFVAHKFRSLLILALLYDITGIVSRADPYFGVATPNVVGYHQLWRLGGFLYGLLIYFLLETQHKMAAAIAVGLGFSRPEDWPNLFHSFKYAYTLRGLWGKSWHQMFRRASILHAKYFTQKLGIPQKSAIASLFTLYLAFAMSGVLHHAGDAMAMQSWTKPGAFHFFMLQAVGITIEDLVLRLVDATTSKNAIKASLDTAKNNGNDVAISKAEELPKWSVRLVGYVWVLLWLALSLPLWTDAMCRNGFMRQIPQYSLILGIWKGEWAPEGWQPVK